MLNARVPNARLLKKALWITGCLLIAACSSKGPAGPTGATGASGTTGATGAPGAAGGTPSISGATPPSLFAGRTGDVELSGYATQWTSSATVSFGDGITVNSITVGSPTDMLVNVTAAPTAAAGPRDVTVTDASGSVTLSGLFSISSPVSLTVNGSLSQGAVLDLQITDLDASHPFDTTTDITGTYTNFALANLPSGVSFNPNVVNAYSADVFLFVDTDAQAGAFSMDIQSGPPGGNVVDFAAPSLAVSTRTASAISGGVASGTVTQLFGSSLYEYSTTEPSSVSFAVATTDSSGAAPGIVILPASGHFADILGYGPDEAELSQAASQFYVIVFDNTGAAANYAYQLTAQETATTFVTAANSNDSTANATPLTSLPAAVVGASLDAITDNWYSLTATADDIGKSVNVTVLDNPNIDLSIDVTKTDGTTSLGGGAPDSDAYTSSAIPAAGTYYVHIYQGYYFAYYAPAGPYDMLVTLQ